jgi:heparosan-N-sulfate-glucuronate 5-epimerase
MGSDLRSGATRAGFFSSADRLPLSVGPALDVDAVRGYPIDLRAKALSVDPGLLNGRPVGSHYVVVAQYGLGCYERWLAGDGETWLDAALRVGRYLLERQESDGSWLNPLPLGHTFPLPAPWRCGMAQGEAASVLVRLYLETQQEEFADAALRALAPLSRPTEEGGVRASLDGAPWPEEYPTATPSYVLNGAIFAWWGMRDVAVGLSEPAAQQKFERGVEALATNLHRFDTGAWSLYCLYPHPVAPVASHFYHRLHINQLTAMHALAPHEQIAQTRDRWERYSESAGLRRRATARKVLHRLVVPRNRVLGPRMPWTRT